MIFPVVFLSLKENYLLQQKVLINGNIKNKLPCLLFMYIVLFNYVDWPQTVTRRKKAKEKNKYNLIMYTSGSQLVLSHGPL